MINKARQFAAAAHRSIDQRRKYTGDEYIVHPAAVAKLVSSVTDDVDMICAAWLHDVVEDTPVSIEEIRCEFGERVASLVADLSDVSKPEDGNRKIRKAMDREHTRQACPEAKTIKLADLIDNAKSIVEHGGGFASVFMDEKDLLLEVLKEGDSTLYTMACNVVREYRLSKK